jgi:HK97 family phage prohead protease
MENLINQKKAKTYAIKSSDRFAIKDVDLATRTVTGFYNTANFYDSDNDIVLPGANNKSIAERGPDSNATQKIKHLMFHDWTMLPGKLVTLEERTLPYKGQNITGTYFETKMANTQMGNDALINYQEGVYDNHSEGFMYMDGSYLDDSDGDEWDKMLALCVNPDDMSKAGFAYVWKELKMYEGSTVAFGANALTPYLGVKSQNKDALILKLNDRIELLGKMLISGTQSDETLQAFSMQKQQLKQIINELFALPPSEKDIVIDLHANEVNQDQFNVKSLLNIF